MSSECSTRRRATRVSTRRYRPRRKIRDLTLESLENRNLLAVVFSTGSGSAVTLVDRGATFDAGDAIDASSHSEDMLFVTTPSGSISSQPGPFDPFTAFSPGASGYFAVANASYVSIRPTDSALMGGVEFTLGDLFGAGPGQPPNPRVTNLVWETYRDGVRTGTDRASLGLRTVVGWSDTEGISELRVAASGFPSFMAFGSNQAIALDDLKVQIDTSRSVTFGTGVGSAVNVADRRATFDAGGAIDVASYTEDSLSITSAEGTIAAQPGSFNPFTGVAPGTSGYFAVANASYVSIAPADSAVVTGIEFKLGDLFGGGPGQPPNPRSTFLVWETFRGGASTGMNSALLDVGTVVSWADTGGIDELRVGASGFPSFREFGQSQAIALGDLRVQIDTSSDVQFRAGAGSSLTSVDRIATFDAGGSINALDHEEDGLSITTPTGSIARQPGVFDPFTGVAPGTSGYYAVSNSSFVSIRSTDAESMAVVEFRIGDLLGVGPGQPPDPFRTSLVWETYRDGVLTGVDRVLVSVGTTVSWVDPSGIDELRVGASGFSTFNQFGDRQAIALDDLKVQLDDDADGVQFSTGEGSAVTSPDRTATFDAAGAIDVADYSEDLLSVTTSAGSIAQQPGRFSPFTGLAPGVSGYYGVANSTFVSIGPEDATLMTGIEFRLGDLFGDGPGRPPNPFSTHLVWETYRDGVRTGTDRILLADGTHVGWSDPAGIDELRVGASGFPNFTRFGIAQAIALDDLKVNLREQGPAFAVASFVPTASGFTAEFTADVDAGVLNVFGTDAAGLGPADAVLRGANGNVAGSLVVDTSAREITFIASGGPLTPGSYEVTLRSATDGFKSVGRQLLDGNGDGTAGDDFVSEFNVDAPAADSITIGLDDLVRGPGQELNLPANGTSGIPITLSDSAGVRRASLQIGYDPELLTITAASIAAGIPDGATVELDTTEAGLATLVFLSPVDLPQGEQAIVNLHASVPAVNGSAIFGSGQVLDIRAVTISTGAGDELPVVVDDSLHFVSYFADVSGNGRINASDAALLARFVALIDQGFASSPLIDPVIVGDITGNGRINAADASRVAQFAALIAVPEIPPIPSGALNVQAGVPNIVDSARRIPAVQLIEAPLSSSRDPLGEAAIDRLAEAQRLIDVLAEESAGAAEVEDRDSIFTDSIEELLSFLD